MKSDGDNHLDLSNKNECVVSIGQPQAQESNDIPHSVAKNGPFLHFRDFSKETANQFEQSRSQKPNSNIVDSLYIDKFGQFLVRNNILGICGWLRYAYVAMEIKSKTKQIVWLIDWQMISCAYFSPLGSRGNSIGSYGS